MDAPNATPTRMRAAATYVGRSPGERPKSIFLFLLRESGLTKGGLSSHLAKVEEAGYVVVTKGYEGRVPHTDYGMTDDGRAAFRSCRDQLRRALEKLPR
jgi:DNA-binding MarR family transcriptional regulator